MTPTQFARYARAVKDLHDALETYVDRLVVTDHSVSAVMDDYDSEDDVVSWAEYRLALTDDGLAYTYLEGDDEDGVTDVTTEATGAKALPAWERATGIKAWDALGLEVLLP
jgi:hypothetical protein